MKFFDEEEYLREKRLAKRSFWSGVALFSIGVVISAATLARLVSREEKEGRNEKANVL